MKLKKDTCIIIVVLSRAKLSSQHVAASSHLLELLLLARIMHTIYTLRKRYTDKIKTNYIYKIYISIR